MHNSTSASPILPRTPSRTIRPERRADGYDAADQQAVLRGLGNGLVYAGIFWLGVAAARALSILASRVSLP